MKRPEPARNDHAAKQLGIAVIGSGRIGTLHATMAGAHPAVNFLAISDQDAAKASALAEKTGADLHSGDNLELISRPEVDSVIVSTSEHEHMVPVIQALERGKPVLVE
ncbi:MAG: Gfo/Idh/MocA family oxidoreductase [Nitrospinota bacterium]